MSENLGHGLRRLAAESAKKNKETLERLAADRARYDAMTDEEKRQYNAELEADQARLREKYRENEKNSTLKPVRRPENPMMRAFLDIER